jgi:hypothetical protein
MTKDGVTCRIDRHGATMDNEGVAILEDAHLADRESGLRRELGPPGRQRHKEEEAEEVDGRRPDGPGNVGGIGAQHRSPQNSGKTVSVAADSTRPPSGIMPRRRFLRQIRQGLLGARLCPGANTGV